MAIDPNAAGSFEDGIYGLGVTEDEARLVIDPVPFDATTSYIRGTASAPFKICKASVQVDLYHPHFPEAWKAGIFMREADSHLSGLNTETTRFVDEYRVGQKDLLQNINKHCEEVNEIVYQRSKEKLDAGKLSGLLGGDHAVPFGHIKAHLEKYPEMGILHIDAHYDLRKAYEGFENSHASIMYNVTERLPLKRLISVGLRDFCEEEVQKEKSDDRILGYTMDDIKAGEFEGKTWQKQCEEILNHLPNQIYISMDVDGLDPSFCPSTGTPVPGGLDYSKLLYLFRAAVKMNKQIVGFDLVEVGDAEYDANVGARLTYELSCLSIGSNS